MRASLSVITLAVQDLDAALRFYQQGLGWQSEGIVGQEFEQGAVAFITLDSGLPLSRFCPTQISLGHNVHSPLDVDQVMQQAERAGATIVKPAQATFYGGYAGYFQDPDGHLWEVVWNPCWEDTQD
ncbi:VOC family protein [Acinetobacter indicus]|uniref:VOC family protein n=1 Tax=Acinetobacter indicus TaxID=756892 RepID=UPI0039899CFA